ncbi:S41 family peptidase [Schnuerera sp.]|uniref:S41 family peptidase n=1 Tax=Schnuerera sp. TaxID=2794844 RepID=UPI002C58AB58|nr:S41 family peptidase [Schnuerera sp.]HSH35381.1 S41 family peptidase [Schnuerera sp.]
MKKAIIFILIFLWILPLDAYAVRDIDYFNTHIKEITEYYPLFNSRYGERLIKYNSKLDTIGKLKKIHSSIDPYSNFFSKDELAINIFDRKDDIDRIPVEYEIIKDIGYIRIFTFNDDIYDKVVDVLKIMDENNINNLVLDLRDNKGGEILESVKVGQLFVKEGLIAKIDYYSEEFEDMEYYSNLKELKYNLIVLVNEETSSAAELLTGAIQDSGSGYIVGNKTHGKSRIQKFIPIMNEEAFFNNNDLCEKPTINALKAMERGIILNNKDILGWAKITVGSFYTRNGKEIEGTGINPDYLLNEMEGEEYFAILCNKFLN